MQECEDAAKTGSFGFMYNLLRQLGARTSKLREGTAIKAEQFNEHFSNISTSRFENDPAEICKQRKTPLMERVTPIICQWPRI